MDLARLNKQFALAQQLCIENSEYGALIQVNNTYVSACISVYGGQVLSFKPHRAKDDLLFLSSQARHQPGMGIRGGIPLCWPWFGADPLEQGRGRHGFARLARWQLQATYSTDQGETSIHLRLRDDPHTLKIWPHPFTLDLHLTLGESLYLALTTHNMGTLPFSLSQALHTYFKISTIHQVSVVGLNALNYLDKTQAMRSIIEQQQNVTIIDETDRIYQYPPAELILQDAPWQRQIIIQTEGSQSSVLWNPGKKGSAAFNDLAPEDYQHFICLETANIASDTRTLAANAQHTIAARYSLAAL